MDTRNKQKPEVPDPARVAARNQQARRASKPLLDPHGIYGTRTAYRVRAAQRRQTFQYLSAFLGLLLCAFLFVSWLRVRRVARTDRSWSVELGSLPSASPALARTKTESWMLLPTESGQLVSLNVASGARGPVFSTTVPLRGEPLADGSRAFVPCEDGTLFALDWRSGQVLWSYRTQAAISARPALVKILMPAKAPQEIPPEPRADNAVSPVPRAPRAAEAAPRREVQSVVVLGNDGGEIIALHAGSGKALWRRKLDAPIGAALTATLSAKESSSTRILVPLMGGVGTRGGVACLEARDGKILWRADLRAAHLSAPLSESADGKSGRVYTSGDDGAVFCLDLKTGRHQKSGWKTFVKPLPKADPEQAVVLRAEPLLQNYSWGKSLFVGGNDGGVRCLNAKTGQILWAADAGAPVRGRLRALSVATPQGNRDLVFIGTDSAFVLALDARSGELVWRFSMPRGGGTTSALPLVDQVIGVSANGSVAAFPLASQ